MFKMSNRYNYAAKDVSRSDGEVFKLIVPQPVKDITLGNLKCNLSYYKFNPLNILSGVFH